MSPPANSWITFLLLIKDGILMALEVDRFVWSTCVRSCALTWSIVISSTISLDWWWRQYAPLKLRSTIILHGSISQKTTLNKYVSCL
jgi:hypothetical protein